MSIGNEVVRLASVVSEAKDEDIPKHLLQLKRLLQQHPENSKEQLVIKQDILKYDLLSWCAVVIKYDFNKIEGGYATAATIIEILFECCVGLRLEAENDFTEVILPEALESSLSVLWQIQQRFLEKVKLYGGIKYGVHAEEKASLKLQYHAIIEVITKVLISHSSLVNTLLTSDNLIRILIEVGEEVEKMLIAALEIILRGIRVNPVAVRSLSTSPLNHLLDELVFKITTSDSDNVAAVTVKIVVSMIDAHPELANKMTVRFKGLKALLTRWMGHGFDRTLQSLIEILDAGNAKIAELARRTHAVKAIWAAYQGWKTRTRVARLHKVVPSLQSSFRRKRQEKLEVALKEKLGNEQRYSLDMARKRSARSTREKHLHMLEIVPAGKVNQHIQLEESKAAVKIQSVWRGANQRKKYTQEKSMHRLSSAAIVIQKAVRRFLARRRKMRNSRTETMTQYSKLTKERKEELQMVINQKRVVRGERETSVENAVRVHDKTQKALVTFHNKRAERSKYTDPGIQAFLAKLHTEEELLGNLPKLSDATEDEINTLSCASSAVGVAAEVEHKRLMKEFTSEWWQKLSLKTGERMDPFEEKLALNDLDLMEIENFIKDDKKDVLFG